MTIEYVLYNRIGSDIFSEDRKISFKHLEFVAQRAGSNVCEERVLLYKVKTYFFFVGAKCRMIFPMDNSLVIFDV